MLRIALTAAVLTAATLVAAASAVGPAPGATGTLVAGSDRWTAVVGDGATTVRTDGATRVLPGSWGFPRTTFGGDVGGLSADGRTLVLVRRSAPGTLPSPSRFVLLDPATLAVRRQLSIPGRFAFDALSPGAAKLYLIEFVTVVGDLRYRVRSYDVAHGRLAKRVIADKRSRWTAMQGMPLSRATTPDGTWAYTLYGNTAKPFVHALNAQAGYAVCIDLRLPPAAVTALRLRLDGDRLALVTPSGTVRSSIDRSTLQLVG